jgi:hypothetical protein
MLQASINEIKTYEYNIRCMMYDLISSIFAKISLFKKKFLNIAIRLEIKN